MTGTSRGDASRLETFSDGVYAVVITLLALDLKPELATEAHGSRALLSQLASRWPTCLNVGYNLTWHVIVSQRGSGDERPRTRIERRISRNYQLGFPAYVVATIVALWSLPLSIVICTALWALWSATMRPVHERGE